MMPGTCPRAACGPCRTGDAWSASDHDLSGVPAHTDRLDRSGIDALTQRGFRDTDVTADAGEPDTPFRHQPPRETRFGPEDFGSLLQRQEPVDSRTHVCY